jgi:hypothetical protein
LRRFLAGSKVIFIWIVVSLSHGSRHFSPYSGLVYVSTRVQWLAQTLLKKRARSAHLQSSAQCPIIVGLSLKQYFDVTTGETGWD